MRRRDKLVNIEMANQLLEIRNSNLINENVDPKMVFKIWELIKNDLSGDAEKYNLRMSIFETKYSSPLDLYHFLNGKI